MLSGFRQRSILLLNLSNFCLAEAATIRCKISTKHRIADEQFLRFKSKTFQNIYIYFILPSIFSLIFVYIAVHGKVNSLFLLQYTVTSEI